MKYKKTLLILIPILLIISLPFAYLLGYRQGSKEIFVNKSSTVVLLEEVTNVEATNIRGNLTEDNLCEDACTADLKITYNEKEISLKDVTYSFQIQTLDPINQIFGSETEYFLLRSGTGNESNTLLFDKNGKKYSNFCSTYNISTGEIILDDKYLVYNDCGVKSSLSESLVGISYLNIQTGEIQPLVKAISEYSENGVENYYYIEGINYSEKELYYKNCELKADSTHNKCTIETLDISEIFKSI